MRRGDRSADTHDRVRHDKIDKAGSVTLRVAGQLRHIGVGRTYARTDVILLVQDLHVTAIDAAIDEILRDHTIDPRRDYQPTGRPPRTNQEGLSPQLVGSAHSDVQRHHHWPGRHWPGRRDWNVATSRCAASYRRRPVVVDVDLTFARLAASSGAVVRGAGNRLNPPSG